MILKQMLFVMNPYAGMRKANRHLPDILALFNRAGYRVTAHMTADTGDCTEVTRELAGKMDLVVCAGGDGTFNEAVNGILLSGAEVPIGYIPCGSTNDFANTLKLSANVMQAAQDILDGAPRCYDAGLFRDRYFTYVASFGAFTRASYATPQNIKNALGHTAYILGGIQELSQIHTEHLRFETEDGRVFEDDFLFGAVCNSTSVGGILTLDPRQVDMSDGRLELLLVRSPRDLAELNECIVALQKKKYNCAMITFLSASRLEVTAPPDMPWTLDGEKAEGSEHIVIENRHQAIRLVQKEKP